MSFINLASIIAHAPTRSLDRPQGSFLLGAGGGRATPEENREVLLGLTWEEVEPEARLRHPEARYFRANLPPTVSAFLAADTLGALTSGMTPEELSAFVADLRVEIGVHGNVQIVHPGLRAKQVDHVHLIVGPVDDAGTIGVWTWFPGGITPFVNPADWTIKLGA